MKGNGKRFLFLFVCILLIVASFPITASADTGPKPSVHVTFVNMGDELCYGTLLSEKPSTGPYSVLDGDDDERYYLDRLEDLGMDKDLWRAFTEYEDPDGYYFLQEAIWKVNETKELAWTYYPPNRFKILLYYPETERFAVSGIYERYAFDTYYTVDMSGVDIGLVDYNEELSNSDRLQAHKSYQWQQEMLSLVARILITIIIEMGIALLFGFRGKRKFLLLVIVNTATQIVLNVLLNLINFRSGSWAFIAGYILFELAVFIVEAGLYSVLMKKITDNPKPTWFYIVYALIANAVSFGAGMAVANLLPGIF